MKKLGKGSFIGLCTGLSMVLFVSLVVSISLGSVNLKGDQVWKIIGNSIFHSEIFMPNWEKSTENIVLYSRLPRVLLAMIAGAGLAISGILMQALTKNPLANPYILGISSGASTGAVVAIMFSSMFSFLTPSLGAFIGALFASGVVFLLGRDARTFSSTRLVLIGVSVAALFSSITNFIIFTSYDYSKIQSAIFWMTGSLSGANMDQLIAPTICLIITYGFIMVFSKGLNGLLLGEATAKTLGIDTGFIQNTILGFTSILIGFLVSVTGVIGFVGLIIPHIARTIVGSDHKKVATLSMLLGAILLIWADVLARILARPEEIPIGVITSFLGAPFFIGLIKKRSYSFGGKNG